MAEIETQFTRLDASVAALRQVQANLKRYRASVLKAACEGRLVPSEAELARSEGRDYEPAGALLERTLAERRARWESQENRQGKHKEPSAPDASALPELPEGWVWAAMPQLGELNRGKSKHRPRNDPKPKPRWDVHLPGAGNRGGSLAGVFRPLIAGPSGSAVSPRLSGWTERPGICRPSPAPPPCSPGTDCQWPPLSPSPR